MLRPILIVDDNADDVDILCHALRRGGVPNPVQSFLGGEEVIAHLTALCGEEARPMWQPLLCVLDVKMPGFHGADVLQWMREHTAFKSVAIVMCSSSDDPKDVQEAAKYGAQCYARKHPSVDEFKALIHCAGEFSGNPNERFDLPCNLLLGP